MKFLRGFLAPILSTLIVFRAVIWIISTLCIDGASSSDLDLWATFNCWWDFVLWQYKAYRMSSDDWSGYGFFDACNLNLPYPKAVNASYLLTYGLSENHALQWHGTIDYRNAGEAWASNTHNQIYYAPSEDRSYLAQAQTGRFLAEDRTLMGCLLFDFGQTNNNPATRAGDYVHEGWHHWQHKHGYKTDHMNGPIDSCTMSGAACDWYYWHTVGQFEFGEMWKYTSDGRFFHSPNQAQVEFLCDLAELASGFVPSSVTLLAKSEANQRLSTRFRNAVGYRCGDPRPW
ncbi:MAG: hypothetical protein ACXWPS_19860 [Ktedonobacteraceae bacterium]